MNLRGASDQRGSTVLIVIAMLAVILALAMTGTHSLIHLKGELKQVERDQTNRLARTPVAVRLP
jgi:Tfp pilus assembly protein PilX